MRVSGIPPPPRDQARTPAPQPNRRRPSNAGRSHDFHARYRSKRRKIGIIVTCPGEQDRRKLARAELG